MKLKIMFAFLIVSALAAAASAQTKISGTQQCAKPDVEHSIPIGDRPDHSFVITQGKCTWTKPFEIAGIQDKGGVETTFAEISGNVSRVRGYDIDTMANGDKVFYRFQATCTLRDGVPQTCDPKWTFAGATGKFKGIKGKGTGKLTSAPADGSSTWELEGEYELPK